MSAPFILDEVHNQNILKCHDKLLARLGLKMSCILPRLLGLIYDFVVWQLSKWQFNSVLSSTSYLVVILRK